MLLLQLRMPLTLLPNYHVILTFLKSYTAVPGSEEACTLKKEFEKEKVQDIEDKIGSRVKNI